MNEIKTSISFTQIEKDIIVPTEYLNQPAINKTTNWVLGIIGVVVWLFLADTNSFGNGMLFSTAFMVGIGLLISSIQFIGRLYWLEFNRSTGKVMVWRTRKKNKFIGEYKLDQIAFYVGVSGGGRITIGNFNLTISLANHNRTIKIVLGNFWELKCKNDEAKPAAEAAILGIKKFLKDFLSDMSIQTENNEIKLLRKL
jgi:hypothetical protein